MNPVPQLGDFRLGMKLDEVNELRPLSIAEMAALGGLTFEGERIQNAPSTFFCNIAWTTVLAAVNEIVYKVSLQWSGTCPDDVSSQSLVNRLDASCKKDPASNSNLSIWDCSDGNIVLHQKQFMGNTYVTLTATSSQVASFKKKNTSLSNLQNLPKLSIRGARLISALIFLLISFSGWYLVLATNTWLLIKVPVAIVSFALTTFSLKYAVKTLFSHNL